MMWLGVYLFGVYWGGSLFTEQDASWHQVIIRDTRFQHQNHVVVFYGSFPTHRTYGVAFIPVRDDPSATVQPAHHSRWLWQLLDR